MKLSLGLLWLRTNRNLSAAFKHSATYELFNMYLTRLGPYTDVDVSKPDFETLKKRESNEKLWICERAQLGAKTLSSEALAVRVEDLQMLGVKKLWIVIGGPDGFSKEQLAELRADFLWSFGPATYPHELASVMMLEQVYRAYSIIKKHPYHSGH